MVSGWKEAMAVARYWCSLVVLVVLVAWSGVAMGQALQVWTTYEGPSLAWLRDEAAAFTAGFGVDVEVTQIALGDLEAAIFRGAPRGEAADVFHGVAHDWIDNLATAGALADMSGYATTAYLADLADQTRRAFSSGGRLYGLPTHVEGPALFLNTDLVPMPPSTYEDMIAMAHELTNADTFGFLLDATNLYYAYVFIRSFGGAVFGRDDDGNLVPSDVQLANEGAVRGLEALRDLRHRDGLLPADLDYGLANQLFLGGRLGMWYAGSWEIANYVNAGLSFVVMPIPPMEDGTEFRGFMGAYGVAVNEFGTNKVNAANFAKWITRSDAQVSLARSTLRVPASQAALGMMAEDPIIAGFGRALQDAEPLPDVSRMGQVWGPTSIALSTILEDPDADVAATLETAVSRILGY